MSSEHKATSNSNFLTPPGGMMVWIFIFMELVVFVAAFVSYFYVRSDNLELFQASQAKLNSGLAMANTIILLTSGYFVLLGNLDHANNNNSRSTRWFAAAIVLGIGFVVIKLIEYSEKIEAGLTTGVNSFYDFYWMLTVFHLFHVVAGLGLLIYVVTKIKRGTPFETDFGIQTASSFWHMCDLIWVLLFPIIYLI